MPQILHIESGWLATFPHVGLPHPDEWLAGLLLRCDEMNHRESGTTWRYLLRATRHPGFGPGSPLIVVPESLLEYLAQRLMVSRERLLATTYACELAQLYTLTPPHTGHLLGPRRGVTIPLVLEKSVGNRANATVVGFHICPICHRASPSAQAYGHLTSSQVLSYPPCGISHTLSLWMSSDLVLPRQTAIPLLYLWSRLGTITSPSVFSRRDAAGK